MNSVANKEMQRPFLLDFSLEDWKHWCSAHCLPSFVAEQIYRWIFERGVLDPSLYTNLSKITRQKLLEAFSLDLLTVDTCLTSSDKSEKFLLKTADNLLIEMVLMPYDNRTTLCLSSQVGCKMGCTFCQTGKMGFKRNLSSGEILAQVFMANAHLAKLERKTTNIVFMGMGEPLDNFTQVRKACETLVDPKGFGLSKSRVTISTSGLVPEIRELGSSLPLRLAISLHSANDEMRSDMMPINRRYPLSELKKALLEYPLVGRHGLTFEYVLIEGKNDALKDAKKLVSFLHGLRAKVNLIPVNYFPGLEMKPSTLESIRSFQKYLSVRSIPAPVRYSRGQDVSGGCGQLSAKREGELDMDPREIRRQRKGV